MQKLRFPNAADVEQLIEHAFPPDPVPPVEQMVRADSPGAWDEISELLGCRWIDIPSDVLGYNTDPLCGMSPEGFLYYLPAYLRKCLREYPQADLIPSEVLRWLTPGLSIRPDIDAALRTLPTTDQKRAVRCFLEFACDTFLHHAEEAAAALSAYWVSA